MIVIVPEYEVAAVGANVTVTVCGVPPGDTVKLDGLTVNTTASLVTLVTFNAALPVFETVNVFCELLPTSVDPKESDVDDSDITGA